MKTKILTHNVFHLKFRFKSCERHGIRGRNAYGHPHFLVVYSVATDEVMTNESQQYNCFIRNGGNTITKHACPEAKVSNPITRLTLKHCNILPRLIKNYKAKVRRNQGRPLKRLLDL
jgi:hypothetical protein